MTSKTESNFSNKKLKYMNSKKLLYFFTALLLLIGCTSKKNIVTKDVLVEDLDSAINPADDFFEYTNGGWFKKNPIPPDWNFWGITAIVREDIMMRLKTLNEEAAGRRGAIGSTDQKVGDFWTMAMDSIKTDSLGLKPLEQFIEKINGITDLTSFADAIAELQKVGSNKLFNNDVSQDEKNSNVMIYTLSQGGIELPEREYYFKDDSATVNIRNKYKKYITKLLILSGEDSGIAQTAGRRILEIETNLAQISQKVADTNSIWNYNKVGVPDLKKICGVIDLSSYLDKIGIRNCDSVVVYQIPFFKALNHILKTTPIRDWKEYLKFHLLDDFADVLPDAYGIEAFNFKQLFGGAKRRMVRWKRVIEMEDDMMGELVGKLYVKKYFSDKARQRYSGLVEALRDAMEDRIRNLNWMSDSTKQRALIKLAALRKEVGYPDKWKDFSALKIGRESFAKNVLNLRRWWHDYQLDKLGRGPDHNEWGVAPQMNNGYYDAGNNEIVLPAAFFIFHGLSDDEIDDAELYGYAGIKIGHEIGHGFDNGGRHTDENGHLKNWWTKKDENEFNKRADKLVKQFNEYEPIKGYT
ncbi:MAG TPA: M13 family metallopeptidase [Hanamia sp.]|nr:M13 family metallopeptidase [Hanamia sp.]